MKKHNRQKILETTTVGRTTVSDAGIFIPSKWFFKEKNILWEDVRKIDFTKGPIRILYRFRGDRLKTICIGHKRKEYEQLVEMWEAKLIEKTADRGYLSGSIVFDNHSGTFDTLLFFFLFALSIFLGVFMIDIFYKAFTETLSDLPYLKPLVIWAAYIGMLTYFPFEFLLAGSFLTTHFAKKKWNNWKIDPSGFSTERDGFWKKHPFRPDDSTYYGITVSGESIPCNLFTNNGIFPYLLAIVGEKFNVYPMPAKFSLIFGMGIRLLVIWPPILLAIWYLPLLFVQIPDDFNLKLRINSIIIGSGCWICAAMFLIVAYVENIKSLREFEVFKSKTRKYKDMLDW